MVYLLKTVIFYSYVSLPEGKDVQAKDKKKKKIIWIHDGIYGELKVMFMKLAAVIERIPNFGGASYEDSTGTSRLTQGSRGVTFPESITVLNLSK